MTENEFKLILRNELQLINDEIRTIQKDLYDFKLYAENTIEFKINIGTENYRPTTKRYERATPETNNIKQDIEVTKKIVKRDKKLPK